MMEAVAKYTEAVARYTYVPYVPLSYNMYPILQVGRQLMEAVAAVPDVSPAEFEGSLNKGLNDLLMVHYPY